MATSVVKLLELIKPHNIGDKIYYINRYGFVRRATIVDIIAMEDVFGRTSVAVKLKVRGEDTAIEIAMRKNMPNRIYANRDRAKRHAPEVVKYFQGN